MTTYQKLQDIVRTSNTPQHGLNGSIDVEVEFLNSVCVMVEELKDSIRYTQKLRPRGSSLQSGVASYLTTRAIDEAYLVSHKYWPEDK